MSARTALVTGAASGLARGIVVDLARAGYRTAFTYREGSSPDQTLAAVSGAGGVAPVAIVADHARAGDSARAVREAHDALGPIDAFVNAVGPIVVKPFARFDPADLRAVLAGNLESAAEGAAAVLPAMRARKYGRLVFFGMNGSHETLPGRGMSLYGAAKSGVVAFARTLALEEAEHGITVNVIEPGDIRDKTADRAAARAIPANNPTGHAGSWEDIAYAVRVFLSDEAAFINGQILAVNGGRVEPYE